MRNLPAHLAPGPSGFDEYERRILRKHKIEQLERSTYVLPFEGSYEVGRFVRIIEKQGRLQAVAKFPNGYHGLFEGESWDMRHLGRAPQPEHAPRPAKQQQVQQVTITQVSFFRRVFR